MGRAKARGMQISLQKRVKACMQGLKVRLAIQGRLVGRGRGNCLQGRKPAPLPTTLCFLSSSSCSRSGCGGGGWGMARSAEGCGGCCNASREL